MVVDQILRKTTEVGVELRSDQLRVVLSQAVADDLDGITEYIVPLEETPTALQDLDAALTAIFAGRNQPQYVRKL